MKTLQGVIKPVLGILALESGEASSLNLQGARGGNVCRISGAESTVRREFYTCIIYREWAKGGYQSVVLWESHLEI